MAIGSAVGVDPDGDGDSGTPEGALGASVGVGVLTAVVGEAVPVERRSDSASRAASTPEPAATASAAQISTPRPQRPVPTGRPYPGADNVCHRPQLLVTKAWQIDACSHYGESHHGHS